MIHFVENKTGNAYDSVEQDDLISNIDLSLFTKISSLPKDDGIWDGKAKAFTAKIYTLDEKIKQIQDKRAAECPPQSDYLDAVVKVAQQTYIDACLLLKPSTRCRHE